MRVSVGTRDTVNKEALTDTLSTDCSHVNFFPVWLREKGIAGRTCGTMSSPYTPQEEVDVDALPFLAQVRACPPFACRVFPPTCPSPPR